MALMQNNDSHSAFPNGIKALVVDSDARFLRSASMVLSVLNFRVATCESPGSAVKLLNRRLRDTDVVFIDSLRATTCGFDFRGLLESHLCIPVVYFLSFDYKVAGDMVDALQCNVWAATYVVKNPLDAEDLCRLWRIIQWSKFLLRRRERITWLEWPRDGSLPATIQALLPSSSTFQDKGKEEDNGSDPFKVLTAGRGRSRKLGDSHNGSSSSHGRSGVAVGGEPTRRLTEGQESDDDDVVVLGSHQQHVQQNRRGVQATDVQNQQHGRSLFMQHTPQMLNMPCNNPMFSADAAGPSSSNAAAFVGASNIFTPALLPAYQPPARARARARSPAPYAVYSAQAPAPAPGLPPPVYQQQQQQPVARYDFGKMVAPPEAHQQQHMFAPWRQGETRPIMLSFQQPPATDPFMAMFGGGMTFGASSSAGVTDAGAYVDDAAMAYLQPEPAADSLDDVVRAMMVMDDTFPRSSHYDNLAAMQAALSSNHNDGSFMVTNVNGGNSASFMAHQDLPVPTGNQVEVGAQGMYGSLLESAGPSAIMFNGNSDMATKFPSDQYDENAMLSLGALWNFDNHVPMHPEGQQVAAADSTAVANATGIMSNAGESGGLGPNWNKEAADEGVHMLEEYLRDNNAAEFLLPHDMNNGHQ